MTASQMVEVFFESYQFTDFAADPELLTLIAEHPTRPRQVGYLVVRRSVYEEPDPSPFPYIYDIAVHPDCWGQRVPHDLLAVADSSLAETGRTGLQADVSEGNPRALKTALKSLGFEPLSRRWARRLGD